jgi:hypothetical protein
MWAEHAVVELLTDDPSAQGSVSLDFDHTTKVLRIIDIHRPDEPSVNIKLRLLVPQLSNIHVHLKAGCIYVFDKVEGSCTFSTECGDIEVHKIRSALSQHFMLLEHKP